jgi:hypothetical protein
MLQDVLKKNSKTGDKTKDGSAFTTMLVSEYSSRIDFFPTAT